MTSRDPRQCPVCDKTFSPRGKKGPVPTYCSPACRTSAWRVRHDLDGGMNHVGWLNVRTGVLHPRKLAFEQEISPAWVKVYAKRPEIREAREFLTSGTSGT